MKYILRLLTCSLTLAALVADLHAQQTAAPTQPVSAQSKRASDYLNGDLPGWLRINGEYRVRLEGASGIAFRPDNTDGPVLSRVRVNTTLIPSTWLKLQFQGQDAQVMGRNAKPDGPPYEDTFDVRQAYVDLGNVEGGKFALRTGRQELVFGEQRLVGHANWLNTARSFDAVRGTYHSKNYRIDAFAASVVNPRDGAFDRRTDGNNFHGVYASFSALVPKATIEPYVFWRVARGVKSEAGTIGKLDFKTFGLRWAGKLPANFDYSAEAAGQTGSLSTDDVRAWAGHWLVGFTMPKAKFTPRLVAEYNYASGDSAATDGRRGTFDQLYPTAHDKYGLADQVGWKNIHDVRSGIELKPTKKLSLTGFYHSWWLVNRHDGFYNAAGALVARVASGGAGRYVGQETDFQAVYALNGMLQIGGGYGHLFPGTFLQKTTPGKAYDVSYLMVTYLF